MVTPPLYVQKKAKLGENKTIFGTFGFWLNLPPTILYNVQKKVAFLDVFPKEHHYYHHDYHDQHLYFTTPESALSISVLTVVTQCVV